MSDMPEVIEVAAFSGGSTRGEWIKKDTATSRYQFEEMDYHGEYVPVSRIESLEAENARLTVALEEVEKELRSATETLPTYLDEGWQLCPDNLRCDVSHTKDQLCELIDSELMKLIAGKEVEGE
jgi:hypothetical protein